MTTGLALQMKWKLAQLARRHNVDLTPIAQPETLPECDPRPMIMRGFATVPVIDRQRMRFRKHSLGWFPWRLPELQYCHQEGSIGEVTSLAWTDEGLSIVCETADPRAMVAGGFSVTTTINSYLIQDADDPMRFHALITAGWINSVSLTPIPACPDALVWDRIPAAPGSNVINLINQFKQSLSQLREITA